MNTCEDGDDLSGLGLEGTFPIFSSNMSLANCSLWEKVVNIQKESVRVVNMILRIIFAIVLIS